MSYHEEQRCGAAVAGKTARACDGCARRRARWYCAADDAFLCQTCDSSVHSANPLARRHSRLRLKSSSCSFGAAALDGDDEEEGSDVPTWLRGFKRKARTPRQGKKEATAPRPPELAETSPSIEEEQLLYCVPVFDPSLAELRSASPRIDEAKRLVTSDGSTPASASTVEATDRFASYLPSDVELAEFAANMESLLGEASVDDSAFSMEKLGLLDAAAMRCNNNATEELKTEQAEEAEQYCPVVVELDIDMTRESQELDFNWPGSSSTAEDEFEEEQTEAIPADQQEETKTAKLRLDYEAVIAAWAVHGSSPWTDGERPQINLASCWTDYLGGAWGDARLIGSGGMGQVVVDEGRQARVSRYREKRRTRLFAKKIRYEVRKLNAEKRPRMKGRFVKRAPGSAVAAFLH
ncbi:zinc finger protein CONSTANS-LIKE 16-like [Curcuma longa]|uniref:zinc finger protein CONSTANS-LIKE 16-like n=1 Tax=Curcuma longa TaxID=136217 RepID=UPI003D9F273A